MKNDLNSINFGSPFALAPKYTLSVLLAFRKFLATIWSCLSLFQRGGFFEPSSLADTCSSTGSAPLGYIPVAVLCCMQLFARLGLSRQSR